jgi:MtaA/CmuA family methyltransferase
MTEKERLLAALRLEEMDRPPCASPLQTGIVDLMRSCDAYWPQANDDPHLMARLAKSAHVVAGLESVRVPFDVTVDATAFGATTGKESLDRQPAVLGCAFTTRDRLEEAIVPDPEVAGRAPVVLEALRMLADDPALEGTPIICGVVGPFMLAGQLRGTESALMDLVLDPDSLHLAVEKASRWGMAFSRAALEAGADVIAIIDATSSGDILSPGQFEEFALPYQRKVAASIREAGGRSVLHICGRTDGNMPHMIDVGADGISVDQAMDIGWVKRQVRGRAACIGNVSPTSTLLFGSPQDVRAETRRVMEAGTDVVAPGCGLAPLTPLANVRAMVEQSLGHGLR